MSNWKFYSKREADHCKSVSVFWLRREGYLYGFKLGTISWIRGGSIGIEVSFIGDMSIREERRNYVNYCVNDEEEFPETFGSFAKLKYSIANNGESKYFNYKINLVSTKCNYGGVRYWFSCFFCGRRVGVIYKKGDYFACRHCQDLTYASKNTRYPVTSCTKIEEIKQEAKRPYYGGKLTRKYRRWMRKNEQNLKTMISLR